ncbi:Aste57867_24574 [Aphanomyces stellatus]|uniref:Ribonuclease n=1 Tax=Aphanomyces stellatus TaxID=120398 RepID=A0A485LQQ9_9STRA|nr:hypothetical protein As57867_024496 [Aphanomyces stellatus]VFU01213.1 Aste57867_24574 [Aphanomyces stellatus]
MTRASIAARLSLRRRTPARPSTPKGQPAASRGIEQRVLSKGYKYVVGVDESGRGPLAGPLVVAACYIPLHVTIKGIRDSKQLGDAKRERLFEELVANKEVHYAVHINSPDRIAQVNVTQATFESMVKAIDGLAVKADFALIDGEALPPQLQIPCESVVKGDSKVHAIAAASIIAKVTRDRLMMDYDKEFPDYNFAVHKGYMTSEHLAALQAHGPSPIYRLSFAPVKNLRRR